MVHSPIFSGFLSFYLKLNTIQLRWGEQFFIFLSTRLSKIIWRYYWRYCCCFWFFRLKKRKKNILAVLTSQKQDLTSTVFLKLLMLPFSSKHSKIPVMISTSCKKGKTLILIRNRRSGGDKSKCHPADVAGTHQCRSRAHTQTLQESKSQPN